MPKAYPKYIGSTQEKHLIRNKKIYKEIMKTQPIKIYNSCPKKQSIEGEGFKLFHCPLTTFSKFCPPLSTYTTLDIWIIFHTTAIQTLPYDPLLFAQESTILLDNPNPPNSTK